MSPAMQDNAVDAFAQFSLLAIKAFVVSAKIGVSEIALIGPERSQAWIVARCVVEIAVVFRMIAPTVVSISRSVIDS